MKIEDLGELSGDIALFGGVYSNLQALEAFLNWTDLAGIEAENCICTGDIVAYCANPAEVTDLMITRGIKSVAGNCEKQLASREDDCGCGFEEGTACDLASKNWFPFAAAQTTKYRAYYDELPDILTFTHFTKRHAVIHGGVSDVARFMWPTTSKADFKGEITLLEAQAGPVDGVICGHSGIAFERDVDGKSWINAGALGMPPHDGRPETRFAILSAQGVVFHRLNYACEVAADAMLDAGLSQGYERALISGVWPSEDILPNSIRR